MTVQRVNPGALRGQAAEMKGQNWHNPAEDAVAPPDAVPSTADAIANLNENAQSLRSFEEWARVENQRIAEMLEIAAQAYQKVDDDYGAALDNPERAAAIDAMGIPDPQTQPPEIPSPAATPRLVDASQYSDVKKTQAALTAPDAGTSLKNAMLYWLAASNRVENNKPKPPHGDWEGDAADTAYARMTTFGNWLTQLSQAWHDLGEAASKILAAHEKAKTAHEPIHQEYVELEARMQALSNMKLHPGAARAQREIEQIHARMEELQKQSDEVRQQYAGEATFTPVRPADPPVTPADGFTSVGGQAGGGGGALPTGDTAAMAQKMGESMGTGQQHEGAGQGAGSAGGSAGGSPSGGGGSPSGAGASGGSPGATEGDASPTGTPKHPADPSLRPAAGGGSGGGSAGGGVGSAPLSPAVTAETVAPAPSVPVTAGAAPAAAAAGGMVGGMGGMAPMHGAHGAQQGKEKRRDPRTAPDEDLYVEDRPWTEGVVGDRRRTQVHDGRHRELDDDQDDDQ
jgi:hypothetical protein